MQGGQATRPIKNRGPRVGDKLSKEERKKALKGYKPSKDDLRRQKERRIKIRQEYAKRTRFRPKGGSAGSGDGGAYDSQQMAPQQQRPRRKQIFLREKSRAQRLAEAESYVDDRPIRGMVGNAVQLDSESHLIHNYDRKRNPLKMLASGTGNTPRGPMSKNHHEVSHVSSNSSQKRQWRKPAEHFEFKEEF